MRRFAVQDKEVPDNTVFWSIVGIITLFLVVLATVMVVRTGTTGNIVLQFNQPQRPFSANPFACLDVPPCNGANSFVCCAEKPLSNGIKCITPIEGMLARKSMCPEQMPYACSCPEKYPYKQSWPIPSYVNYAQTSPYE